MRKIRRKFYEGLKYFINFFPMNGAEKLKFQNLKIIKNKNMPVEVHEPRAYVMPADTLAECIWRESRVRVARDETGRVQLSTLLPRALNFGTQHEATAR